MDDNNSIKNETTVKNKTDNFPNIHSKSKKAFEIKTLGHKINDYFSRFYFIKLNELGEDHENYGDMVFKGENYPPLKINLHYIMKRAKEKELAKLENKDDNIYEKIIINDDYSDFDFNDIKNKLLIKNLKFYELSPLKSKNQNKSMENLPFIKCEKKNSKIFIDILNEKNVSNNSILSEDNHDFNININRKINSKNNKSRKRKNNLKDKYDDYSLPKLNNKIMITNKNFNLFIKTDKTEVKTDINKRNHILKRNAFLKRYDKKESIDKRIKILNEGLIKLNDNIIKAMKKSNEDIPQFNLRFNNLMNKFKNPYS